MYIWTHHMFCIVLVWDLAIPIHWTRAYELLFQAILALLLNMPPLATNRFETSEWKVYHPMSIVYVW